MQPTKDAIYELLSKVHDPEMRQSLSGSGLIEKDWIDIEEDGKAIHIAWKPTVPGCPLVAHISAAVRMVVEKEYPGWSAHVRLREGISSAEEWNKRLKKKEYLEQIGKKLKDSRMWDAIVKT